jgi:hypothetical protein
MQAASQQQQQQQVAAVVLAAPAAGRRQRVLVAAMVTRLATLRCAAGSSHSRVRSGCGGWLRSWGQCHLLAWCGCLSAAGVSYGVSATACVLYPLQLCARPHCVLTLPPGELPRWCMMPLS